MSWRAPTTDDFRDAILEDELTAWQDASVAEGKDPTAKAIANAVGRFRAALRSGFKGTIGVAGTLPEDLIPQAMHLAAYFFLAGRGGDSVSDGRRTLYEAAVRYCERIEEGKVQFADPDDTESTEGPSPSFPSPSFIARPRLLDRDSQSGL
jgi:phage gp36-like protein